MTAVERPAAWVVILAACAAPWAIGAVETTWSSLLSAVCVVSVGVAALAAAVRGPAEPGPGGPVPWLLLAAVPLVALTGLVPLPEPVRAIVAPGATEILREVGAADGWRPVSLAPYASREALAWAVALAGGFVLVLREAARPGSRLAVAAAFAATGAGLAVLGIVQDRTQTGDLHPRIYWTIGIPDAGTPFGPYVNRNHFAGAMVLLAGISGGEALAAWYRARRTAAVVFGSCTLLMLAALAATTSRGGALAAAAGAVVLIACAPRGRRFGAVAAAVAIVVAVGAVLAWSGLLDPFLSRMTNLYGRWRNRFIVQRDALDAFRSSPLLGTGAGTFEPVFPVFQRGAADRWFENAHSDWAQLLMETGVAGAAVALACMRHAWRRVTAAVTAGPGPARWRAAGPAAGVAGVVVHGFFEVNLHVPANALLAVCAVSLACAAAPDTAPAGDERAS